MALDTIPKQEGGKLKAVASGTLPSGQPVVVNSDGTVSVIEETSVSQATGSPVVFESSRVESISVTYDSNAQKVVIAYKDDLNDDYGTAVVGTVSGTSITFGTPVVFDSSTTNYISAVYDSNAQKVVIAFGDTSVTAMAIVGTVSGTSISFGSIVVFDSNGTTGNSAVYDSAAQKVVIAYTGNSSYGTAIVGTVSGTSISFGSSTVFESASSQYVSAAYDSTEQKVVIAYRDGGNSNRGTAIVGTVSGTSISFGTATVFETGTTNFISPVYDSKAQRVVIAYSDDSNSTYGTVVVGTVSGTSISFQTPVLFASAITEQVAAAYHATSGDVVISYKDRGNSDYGTLIVGTVSGDSISFGSEVVFESARSDWMSMAYDNDSETVVIGYSDFVNGPSWGTSVVFQPAYTATNLTAENYIGMSTGGAVADTGSATIDIVGTVNKEQSGLTPGQQYYVQTDGTIGTTPADPSVLAGTAVSATKMVVKS